MYKRVGIAIFSSLMIAGCGGGGSGSGGGSSRTFIIPVISNTLKTAYLDAINDARGNDQDCNTRGVFVATTALSWSTELYDAAYEHSYDLAESDTFEHNGSGTSSDITAKEKGLAHSTPVDRITNNGYSGYVRLGENITAGTHRDTAQKAIDAWLASDNHCANLMNPNYNEIGMAHYEKADSTYSHYWTQEFGEK